MYSLDKCYPLDDVQLVSEVSRLTLLTRSERPLWRVGLSSRGCGARLLAFLDALGRRNPIRCLLEPMAYLEQLWQVNTVAVAAERAHFMLMSHNNRVEVTHLNADAAQYTPVEVNLEAIYNLSSTTFPFFI